MVEKDRQENKVSMDEQRVQFWILGKQENFRKAEILIFDQYFRRQKFGSIEILGDLIGVRNGQKEK